MPSLLTDYDHAVLVACRIGQVRPVTHQSKRRIRVVGWMMGESERTRGVDVSRSMERLKDAGEILTTMHGHILFPGTPEYDAEVDIRRTTGQLIRDLRAGRIKITDLLKGTNDESDA